MIYRWRVQKVDEEKFKAAWAKATTKIREFTVGARGSVLLQSHQDPTEFVTIARWDKIENSQNFWKDSSRTEMQDMHTIAERLSADAFDEIEDYTV
ncbi:MAG: antibiotic biosynthesis monooxygenase [Planctomycetes bacterium]|nr:antibiotic biosynthesis monooxygenase [Planctomycetota bacterium]